MTKRYEIVFNPNFNPNGVPLNVRDAMGRAVADYWNKYIQEASTGPDKSFPREIKPCRELPEELQEPVYDFPKPGPYIEGRFLLGYEMFEARFEGRPGIGDDPADALQALFRARGSAGLPALGIDWDDYREWYRQMQGGDAMRVHLLPATLPDPILAFRPDPKTCRHCGASTIYQRYTEYCETCENPL